MSAFKYEGQDLWEIGPPLAVLAFCAVVIPSFVFGVGTTAMLWLAGLLYLGGSKWLGSSSESSTPMPNGPGSFDAATGFVRPMTVEDVHRAMDEDADHAFAFHEFRDAAVGTGERCPFCRDDLSGLLAFCGGCNTSLHFECLEEARGCTTLGCHSQAPSQSVLQ